MTESLIESKSMTDDQGRFPELVRLFCFEKCGISGQYVERFHLTHSSWKSHSQSIKHKRKFEEYEIWISQKRQDRGDQDQDQDQIPEVEMTLIPIDDQGRPLQPDEIQPNEIQPNEIQPDEIQPQINQLQSDQSPNYPQADQADQAEINPIPQKSPRANVGTFFSPSGQNFLFFPFLFSLQFFFSIFPSFPSFFSSLGLNTMLSLVINISDTYPFPNMTFAMLFFWRFYLAPYLVLLTSFQKKIQPFISLIIRNPTAYRSLQGPLNNVKRSELQVDPNSRLLWHGSILCARYNLFDLFDLFDPHHNNFFLPPGKIPYFPPKKAHTPSGVVYFIPPEAFIAFKMATPQVMESILGLFLVNNNSLSSRP